MNQQVLPAALRQPTCVLCGGPNACAAAACGRLDVGCWCRSASFAPALLARIPAPQRGVACVCATCAAAAAGAPEPASAELQGLTPFGSAAVAQAFQAFPPPVRGKLLALRELIFDTAAGTPGVGRLDETLKWGEPAYVTAHSGSGSTIRVGWKKAEPTRYAMYFLCQTNLVETFRTLFPREFRFEGRRAIVFELADSVPTDAMAFCIAVALTYRLKRRPPGARK